jgi:peptidoglycan/LPS O-acetylase OafA/YrhL
LLLGTEYRLPGVFDGLPDSGVNGSLWSLPLEFRLYIVFLVLAVARLMTPGRYSPLAIVVVIVGYFITPQYELLTRYSNWVTSAAFFLAGGFLWHHRHWIHMSYSTAGVLVVACGAFLHTDRFGFIYFLTLPYLTLFLAFLPGLPKIHERDLSYGVYLYGWPVAQLVQYVRPATVAWENTALACLGALALAFFSWELIEKPALSLKQRFK